MKTSIKTRRNRKYTAPKGWKSIIAKTKLADINAINEQMLCRLAEYLYRSSSINNLRLSGYHSSHTTGSVFPLSGDVFRGDRFRQRADATFGPILYPNYTGPASARIDALVALVFNKEQFIAELCAGLRRIAFIDTSYRHFNNLVKLRRIKEQTFLYSALVSAGMTVAESTSICLFFKDNINFFETKIGVDPFYALHMLLDSSLVDGVDLQKMVIAAKRRDTATRLNDMFVLFKLEHSSKFQHLPWFDLATKAPKYKELRKSAAAAYPGLRLVALRSNRLFTSHILEETWGLNWVSTNRYRYGSLALYVNNNKIM